MSAATTTTLATTTRIGWLLRSDAVQARMARFVAIGWTTTALCWALFLMMRTMTAATWATLVAIVVSTLINTAAQRRYTFDSGKDEKTARRDHLMSLAVFTGAWLLSMWAISLLTSFAPNATTLCELAVAQACTLLGSAVRFTLLQVWSRHSA